VKSCDNTIRHNTFIASYGTLSLRHGNRNRVEGNYFFGNGKAIGTSPAGASLYTGGIRIYGTDHVIINNYMEGLNGTRWDAPITLTLGDAIDGQSSSLSKHFRAERVTIAYNSLVNNSHGIEIGYDNNDNYTKDLADITIAHNLITGSENSLVEIVDTDNDQGAEITWMNNLMYPTGDATLLAGASSTSFDAASVNQENPHLVFDGTENTWKTTGDSPRYENAIPAGIIYEDIDGQTRPSLSNPGADHFSMESIRYTPLTLDDVGPSADEDTSTSTSDIKEKAVILIYPVPTNSELQLRCTGIQIRKIEVLDIYGQVRLSHTPESGVLEAMMDTSSLLKGTYIVRVTKVDKTIESKRIIIQ